MLKQNNAHHTRYVTGYHFVLSVMLIIGTITALVNVYLQWSAHYDMLNSILIALLFICSLFVFYFMRQFPLRAQDRSIRAEESLRHYILTHKALDSRVTMAQVIALRFAPDDEFIVLADRAAKENLTPKEIKQEIRNWRADNHRL
jgi:glucan phosphoethanolaminetransferase (alkaline phosphatase superfamily)